MVLVGEPDEARVGGSRSHCLASSRYARPPPWEVGEHPGGVIVGLVLRIADRDSWVGRLYWPADVPTREGLLFGRKGPAGRSTIRQRAASRQADLAPERNVSGINFYVDASVARPYSSLIDGEGRRDRPTTEPDMTITTTRALPGRGVLYRVMDAAGDTSAAARAEVICNSVRHDDVCIEVTVTGRGATSVITARGFGVESVQLFGGAPVTRPSVTARIQSASGEWRTV